jgi:RHS repeat-associated protein
LVHFQHDLRGKVRHASTGTVFGPRYGLATSTTTDDSGGATPASSTAQRYTDGGLDPVYGLVTAAITDPTGLALTTLTGYETPATGYLRRLSTTMPAGGQTTYAWWGDTENPTAITCPDGTTTGSGSQAGLAKSRTWPVTGRIDTYRYDTLGRSVATAEGSDWTCTSYDTRGRTAKVIYPAAAGARTDTSSYTAANGNPLVSTITETAPGVASTMITTTVDLLGRTVDVVDAVGAHTTTGYDQAGRAFQRATTIAGQTSTVATDFDDVNRPTAVKVTDAASPSGQTVASVTYTDDKATLDPGAVDHVDYPTGVRQTVGRDPWGQTATLTYTKTGSPTITDSVVRSLTGRITTDTLNGTGVTYSYDTAGRLTRATGNTHDYTYSYTYQTGECTGTDQNRNAGADTNRTRVTDNGTVTDLACYDNADRLVTSTAAGTPTYDPHGNTLTVTGASLGYDPTDRHTTTTAGANTDTLTRDPLDRIIETDRNSVAVARYAYTDTTDSPVATITPATGAVTEWLLALPGGVLLTRTATTGTWSLPNIHSDVMATTDNTGTLPTTLTRYDPFGTPQGTAPANLTTVDTYSWLGQHQRPTNTTTSITDMGARPYHPTLGRFLTVDPVPGGSATDYDYVTGDPNNNYDLNGNVCIGRYCIHAPKAMNKAIHWAYENRDTLAGIGAFAMCVGFGGVTCGIAVGLAYTVRAQMRIQQSGFRGAVGANAADGILTAATFGLGQFSQSQHVTNLGPISRIFAKAMFALPAVVNWLGCQASSRARSSGPYCT